MSSFDSSLRFKSTAAPDIDWKPGQGCNESTSNDIPYKLIEPGKTEIDKKALYRIMLGGISPRPVALVGTYNSNGTPNLAPISWYQMVSHNPPLVMISFGGRRERIKDSEQNILTNKQYTISCSTEQYAEAINFAAINAPTGTSEFALTGLTPVPAVRVHAPRVGEAPFAMELEVDHTKQWNNDEGDHSTTMVIGRVKMIHLRQDIIDDETGGVDIKALRPISRFAGTTYGRSVVGYDLSLPIWDEWKEDLDLQAALEKGPKKPDMDSIKATIVDKFPKESVIQQNQFKSSSIDLT